MKYIKLFEGFFRYILDHEVSNEPGVDIHSFKFRGRVAISTMLLFWSIL